MTRAAVTGYEEHRNGKSRWRLANFASNSPDADMA
jgi:hypothetical protein